MPSTRAERNMLHREFNKQWEEFILKNPASRERLQNWKPIFPPGCGLEASATLNPKETFTPARQEDWQPYRPFRS